MSRDATSRAQQASDRDMSLSKQYGGNADSLYGQLTPMYSKMATNPQGFTKGEMNDMTTSSMQSTGGSVAGAVGEGNLEAARTGNVGGYQGALRDAARRGIVTNSNNALGTQRANTALKEVQREQGISGLQGLQTQAEKGSLEAMGLDTGAINAETEAGKSGWFQNMIGLINAGANAASAASGFKG